MTRTSFPAVCLVLLAAGSSALVAACSTHETVALAPPPEFTLETDTYSVEPGQEKYVCFAQTLDHDFTFDRIAHEESPGVHHLLFARTVAPEPEGLSECNVLIRSTWIPMFGTGKTSASLETPSGSAFTIKKGDQVLVQLHLLNTSSTRLEDRTRVVKHPSTLQDPTPVGIYAYGTSVISLPPHTKTDIVNECTPNRDVDLFAILPHMHKLGYGMTLEVGTSANDAKTVFASEAWSFDQQFIASTAIHIPKGSYTKTTCRYDNQRDQTVSFGESSNDEMCYLVGFEASALAGIDGCVRQPDNATDGGTSDSDAGACGTQTPNDKGIGKSCTAGGAECAGGLSCTADQDPSAPGFCMKIGCTKTADCGGGSAVCCAPKQGGGVIGVCLPSECQPSDCPLKN